MERIPLNKTTLLAERRKLSAYRNYLPALEVKRRSLIQAHAVAARLLDGLEQELADRLADAASRIPMLGDQRIDVERLLSVERVDISTERVSGVSLPRLDGVRWRISPVGVLVHPHWVDAAVDAARAIAGPRIAIRIARRRVDQLAVALARATQRVNLLERVLIPRSVARIRLIDIRLADLQRSDVVTGKMFKSRKARMA